MTDREERELNKSKGRSDSDFFSDAEDDFFIDLTKDEELPFTQDEAYNQDEIDESYNQGEPDEDDESHNYNEDEPDEDEPDEDELDEAGTNKRLLQIGGIVGIIILALTFSAFLLSNAMGGNGQVDNLDSAQITNVVNDLFSDEGTIKRDLSKDELDMAKQYVNNLDEGTAKVELRLKVTQAEEQLTKQTQALSLVQGVMKDGQPYIDINRNSLAPKVTDFPMNFNQAYAQELSTKYYNAYEVIEAAYKLEDEFYSVINNGATTLADVDVFRVRLEQLPASQLKTKLSRAFNNKVEELKKLTAQSKDEESKRLEAESLSRLNESRSLEESVIESLDVQNSIESESIKQAESESLRLEMERQESIRQESIYQESLIQESIYQESLAESIQASLEESIRNEQNNQPAPAPVQPTDPLDETVN